MDLNVIGEIFSKFLWPIVLAYIAYIHNELNKMHKRHEELLKDHYFHVAQINKDFATREVVKALEDKVTAVLNRIDDKVTRILEERK